MEYVTYNNKKIPVINNADVVIVGGGTAGVVAAISALNEKKSVTIIEKSIFLGGTSTNGMVTPFMNSFVAKKDGLNVSLNEQYLQYDPNAFYNGKKEAIFMNCTTYAMFYDYKINSLGGKIYYDATFIDVIKENNKILYAIAYIHNDLFAIKGKCFVDTSAEAVLSKACGIELMVGQENTHKNQAVSLRYEMGGIDKVKLVKWLKAINYKGFGIPEDPQEIEFIRDESFEDIINTAIANGEVSESDMRYIQAFRVPGRPNTFAFNGPQLSDKHCSVTPDGFQECISTGLASIRRYSNFMINHIPGFEHAYISSMASMLGVRESVRVKTDYVLQNSDYTNRSRFKDGIAKADWYVDVHEDVIVHDIEPYEPGEYYEIPYRSLISSKIDNLIVGGRIIGCSFRVEASIRIQITIRDVAEVIGKACAYSINNNIDLNKIDGSIWKVS